jgi:hypothetical protein
MNAFTAHLRLASLLLIQLLFLGGAQAQVILTEINSNAAGGDFWELTNVGTAAQDLSNWKWIDGGQSLPAPAVQIFPSGTSLAVGETMVIITDTTVSTTFLSAWGPLTGIQKLVGGPGLGQNDSVRLYDNNDNLIFTFSYASGGFTQSSGSASAGGHAGLSAGGLTLLSARVPGGAIGRPQWVWMAAMPTPAAGPTSALLASRASVQVVPRSPSL